MISLLIGSALLTGTVDGIVIVVDGIVIGIVVLC